MTIDREYFIREYQTKYPQAAQSLPESVLTRSLHNFSRTPGRTVPPLTTAWSQSTTKHDPEFMARLAAYVQSVTKEEDYGAIWSGIAEAHKPLMEMLRSNQLDEADAYLEQMYNTPLMNGMCQGELTALQLLAVPQADKTFAERHFDVLLGVCEYLSIIPTYGPEQGANYAFVPPDILVQEITKMYPWFESPNWLGGLHGLATSRGIFNDRVLTAFYIAEKISRLAPDTNLPIVEIGGGGAMVAYWLCKFGFTDFSMVDIPSVMVAQAYMLAQNFGSENVQLPNENGNARIKFVAAEDFNAGGKDLGLVVNCDSMPEMPPHVCLEYLKTISENAQYFFSMNQESRGGNYHKGEVIPQNSVTEMVIMNFDNMVSQSRNTHWLRKGYVEEVYTITKTA